MERRRTTLGMAVDACLKASTEEWFREHAGMRSREEAAANDFRQLTTSTVKQSGGRLQVYICIVTRDRMSTITDVYHFQQQGKLGYVETAQSKRKV